MYDYNMPLTVVLDNKTNSQWPRLTFVMLLFPRAFRSGPDLHKLIFKKEVWEWELRFQKISVFVNLYTLHMSLHPGHFLLST